MTREIGLLRSVSWSRAILLVDLSEPFAKQLVQKLAETFELRAAVLYDRRTETFFRAGPTDFEGLDNQLRDAALQGTSFNDPQCHKQHQELADTRGTDFSLCWTSATGC